MFPCTSCGACCRHIDKSLEKAKEIEKITGKKGFANFPYTWDENGKCENLLDDGKCKVYATRPEACRIDAYHQFMPYLSKKQFYELNIQECNNLMKEEGIYEQFKITNGTD